MLTRPWFSSDFVIIYWRTLFFLISFLPPLQWREHVGVSCYFCVCCSCVCLCWEPTHFRVHLKVRMTHKQVLTKHFFCWPIHTRPDMHLIFVVSLTTKKTYFRKHNNIKWNKTSIKFECENWWLNSICPEETQTQQCSNVISSQRWNVNVFYISSYIRTSKLILGMTIRLSLWAKYYTIYHKIHKIY